MKIFLSSEVDTGVGDLMRKSRLAINDRLQKIISKNDFGSAIEEIGIIPCVFSDESPEWRNRKERKNISHIKKSADMRLNVNYYDFVSGNDRRRVKLLLENIIESIKIIGERVKEGFDSKGLIIDIRNEFEKELE